MASKEQPLTCYLSVPVGTDTTTIRQVLNRLSVRIEAEESTPPPGESPIRILTSLFRNVDFVCGVIAKGEVSANVLFELGLASGLGRPLLIIVEGKAPLPIALQSYPQIQGPLSDIEPLTFHLRLFLRNLHRPRRVRSKTHGESKLVGKFPSSASLADLKRRVAEPEAMSTSEIEHIVHEVLTRLGAEVTMQPKYATSDRVLHPDMVAWVPGLPPDIGNPMIFECKHRLSLGPSFDQTIDEVRRYLNVTRLRSAVVVLAATELPAPSVHWAGEGYIFLMSLNDFLTAAERGRFVESLVSKRNRFVHPKP